MILITFVMFLAIIGLLVWIALMIDDFISKTTSIRSEIRDVVSEIKYSNRLLERENKLREKEKSK